MEGKNRMQGIGWNILGWLDKIVMRQTASGNAIWGLKNLGFRAGSRSALRL